MNEEWLNEREGDAGRKEKKDVRKEAQEWKKSEEIGVDEKE